jgi:hypothetical protein
VIVTAEYVFSESTILIVATTIEIVAMILTCMHAALAQMSSVLIGLMGDYARKAPMADYARRGRIATVDLDSSEDDEAIDDSARSRTDDDRSNSAELDNSAELHDDRSNSEELYNSAELHHNIEDHAELYRRSLETISTDDETVAGEPQAGDVFGPVFDIEEGGTVLGFGVEKEEEADWEEVAADEEAWEEDQAVEEYEEQPIPQTDEEEGRAVQEVQARTIKKRPARAQTTPAPKEARQRRQATDAEDNDNDPLINLLQSGVRDPMKQRRRKKVTAPKAPAPKAKELAKKKKKKRKQPVPSAEPAATESAEPVATESGSQGSVLECEYGVRMSHLEDVKRCCKCQNILPATIVLGLRLKRKTPGALMCKVCGTRQVQVSRALKEAGYAKQILWD